MSDPIIVKLDYGNFTVNSVNEFKKFHSGKVSFPDIKYSDSCTIARLTPDVVLTDADHCNFMPPECQLSDIEHRIKDMSDPIIVKLDYGHFTVNSVNKFRKFHSGKVIKQKVITEKHWFTCTSPSVDCEKPICLTNIEKYCDTIFKNSGNRLISINGQEITVDEMTALCGTRWLNDAIIHNFISIVNSNKVQNRCYVTNINQVRDIKRLAAKIKKEMGGNLSDLRVVFLAHVGIDENGSYLGDNTKSANHFSIAVYSWQSNEVFYADTKGWPIPPELSATIKDFGMCWGSNKIPNLIYCHHPSIGSDVSIHNCSSRCSPLFPLQSCSSICGIAAMLLFIFASYDWNLFLQLVRSTDSNELERISYLKHISDCSDFLRFVFIDWFMSGNIDLTVLYKKKFSDPLSKSEKIQSPQANIVQSEKPAEESVSLSDSKIVTLKLNPSSSDLLNTKKIEHLLAGQVQLSYLQSEFKLRLRCKLKQGGQFLSKRFSCSQAGKSDLVALQDIQSFIDSDLCTEWLEKGISGSIANMSSINEKGMNSLPPSSSGTQNSSVINKSHSQHLAIHKNNVTVEWIEDGQVAVGVETRRYLDALKFNVTTEYKVHKHIEPVYDADTLTVSVCKNVVWGKTHRPDDTYKLLHLSNKPFTAVTMYVTCSSKSAQCKSACGSLLASLETTSFQCGHCGFISESSQSCGNCSSVISSQWCKQDNGLFLCKACDLFIRRTGRMRPKITKPTVPSVQSTHSHFKCQWQIKLVINSSNLKTWTVYKKSNNTFCHQEETIQELVRPSLSVRDNWDKLRIATKATPQQIFSTEHKSQPTNFSQQGDKTYHSIKQIKARCRVVDKHYLLEGMSPTDSIPIESDWRNTEKNLERNCTKVLLFQRGLEGKGRCYHIVLAPNENLHGLAKYGKHVSGFDIKQDFMAARFKTGLLTYCDNQNAGRAAAVSICNTEDFQSQVLTLQIVLGNIPCNDDKCLHQKELYLFNDENGFFWLTPCSLLNPFNPVLQHDKALDIRNAALYQLFHSSLCNYHGLNAFRVHVNEDPVLRMLLRPLEKGFKCIMRAWNEKMRNNLIAKYVNFILKSIPEDILNLTQKQNFIDYLNRHWFNQYWKNTFTAEVLFLVPKEHRRNPLLLTDNITERKFKEIDETDFGSRLNRSLAQLVWKFINQILHRESDQTTRSSATPKMCPLYKKSVEVDLAKKGIYIACNGGVKFLADKDTYGWVLVNSKKESCENSEETNNQSDTFFVDPDNDSVEDVGEFYHNPSLMNTEINKLTKQIFSEHNYDVFGSCRNLLDNLNDLAIRMYHDETLTYLPDHILSNKEDINCYICNIYLCSCTCPNFITRGQPYFCKHLYACLSKLNDVTCAERLVDLYTTVMPTIPDYLQHLQPKENSDKILVQDKVNKLLAHSHKANNDEITCANNGKLLSVLHTAPVKGTQLIGRPAKRAPHNAGFRRKSGPLVESNALISPDLKDAPDPYRPQVKFPENTRDRHGGRKMIRASKRGLNLKSVLDKGLKQLGVHMKKSKEEKEFKINASPDVDSSKSIHDTCPDLEQLTDNFPASMPVSLVPVAKKQKMMYQDTIACGKCLDEKKQPFTCSNKKKLDFHMQRAHREEHFVCAKCLKTLKIIVRFSTEKEFKNHQKSHLNESDICTNNNNLPSVLHTEKELSPPGVSDSTEIKITNVSSEAKSHIVDNTCIPHSFSVENQTIDQTKPKEYAGSPSKKYMSRQNFSLLDRDHIISETSVHGNPGRANLAKVYLQSMDTPCQKSAGELLDESEICGACSTILLKPSSQSVSCRKCNTYFHRKCVTLSTRSCLKNWVCLECTDVDA